MGRNARGQAAGVDLLSVLALVTAGLPRDHVGRIPGHGTRSH